MRKLRKGLTWLSVIVFFLGVGIFYTQETKAAVTQDGSPDHPFITNDRSIERYFFDKYKNKSEIASAWSKYQSYAKSNDDAPWYIRLGDTSKLSEGKIALNSDDTDKKKYNDEPLYVCWISKLKRASSSKHGTYDECATNSTGNFKVEDVGGGGTYYNTFGYGVMDHRYDNWANSSNSASLGQDDSAFIWYDGSDEITKHTRVTASKNSSGKINSFWMYTSGGDVGYVVYYVKYYSLYEFLSDYNAHTKPGNQFEPEQQDDSSKDVMGQKYMRYNIYLNGSIALHSSSGWRNNSKTWFQNKDYFSNLSNPTKQLSDYADQNYNRHIKLHVLNGVPIVVRAWDITTNQIVSQTVGSSTDYYLQAFDSELEDVKNSDGVYWDVNSEVHTTDIQHALIKFLYKDVQTDSGKKTNRARVAYDIDGYKFKSMQIDNYVRKKNAEANTSSAGDDGLAVLYLPKLDGMTSSDKAQTANAYAPVGIRVFAVDGEKHTLASLRKKNYSQLRNYDPATGDEAKGDFSYNGNVVNYCYDVPKIDVGGEKIRALNFDIRHDVRTADGVLSYKTRMEWPKGAKYDGSRDGHTNENVIACKFFARNVLSTKVNKLQNKNLWRTMDGTRYVYVGQKSAGKNAREYLENGKVALASIKEVAQGLGAKYSDFTMKNSKTLNVEDPSCIVIDVLVSEMYYDQAKYNIEQLSVIDNKYDDEHGVWGYTGSGSTVVGTIEAADGAEADDTRSVPDVVHSEADDSKSGNSVSLLDSFRKKSDNYLRLDIDTYGKKINTNKDADGSSHSDGVVYTLEGWSHYVSPSNNKVDATNAGYMDSLDSSFDKLKINENEFALYSSEWYKRMDAFGDKDDDPDDGKISAKLAKQRNLLVDAWTYNLFYVIKPPIIGIVYVYNEDTNTYDVKYVSARSYKTFGTSNLTKARKKAVDNQLKSKGVATYHWSSNKNYTKQPEPRADVTFDFNMPEQTTAIVAVYGGTAKTAPTKKTFKMRVQYLQYDGTAYKEINTETIEETGTGDKLTVTPKIDVGKATILDMEITFNYITLVFYCKN